MSLRSRIKAATSALFGQVVDTSLPMGVLDFMNRFGKVPDVSRQALVQKYFGWTYACANVSAVRVASTPLRVYAARSKGESRVKNFRTRAVDRLQSAHIRRLCKSNQMVVNAEEFEELEEHPLLTLMKNVNDQENSFEIKELTSIMLDLTGDGYWMIERDKMGIPSKFFVLRSQWVRIIPDREKFIKSYWYGYNNAWGTDTRLELPPDSVIHFKYPNPLDPWYGMGPVQAAAYAIENQELREKFMLATLNNMGRPDLIVRYTEGELDPRERTNLEREWNAQFRGAKNTGKVKVTDFRYEIEKLGWSPSELDFNRGEDWILKKICSAFPVPLGLIDSSQISRAPRSGMEGSDLFMAQFNTLPRCVRIQEKLNEQLCPMYDERLFVCFDNPVPKDRREQLAEDTQKLTTFRTTVNELRARDGEEPVEWGDIPLATNTIVPLGSATSEPSPEPDKEPAGSGRRASANASPGGLKPKPAADDEEDKDDVDDLNKLEGEKGLGRLLRKADVELDGQHVHPSLRGVPVKIRLRNEGGRFDKRDPSRLRATREVIDALRMKGDLPGHPFRGNQYSDGEGGGEGSILDQIMNPQGPKLDAATIAAFNTPRSIITGKPKPKLEDEEGAFIRVTTGHESRDSRPQPMNIKPTGVNPQFFPKASDRNSDEASDARYFAKVKADADRQVTELKDKIAAGEAKLGQLTQATAEHARLQRELTRVQVERSVLEMEHKAAGDRIEKLRQEWESRWPNKPLPAFARRKSQATDDEREMQEVANALILEADKLEKLTAAYARLTASLDKLIK